METYFELYQRYYMTYYIEINAVCILLGALLMFWNIKENKNSRLARLFNLLLAELMIYCVSDAAAAIFKVIPAFSGTRVILYAANITYIILPLFLAITWEIYNSIKFSEWGYTIGTGGLVIIGLLIVSAIAILTTPASNFGFYLDENNIYHRGIGAYIVPVFCWIYLISISVKMHIRKSKIDTLDGRKIANSAIIFVIPPFVVSALQVAIYGISITQIGFLISLYIVFLNDQRVGISRDALTKIYNRRECENALFKLKTRGEESVICIVDVNKFKSINDTFGHAAGDRALQDVANILSKVCVEKLRGFFLGRFGGDEFLLIGKPGISDDEIRAALQAESDNFNASAGREYEISLDVGISRGVYTDEMFKEADERMYEMKKNR